MVSYAEQGLLPPSSSPRGQRGCAGDSRSSGVRCPERRLPSGHHAAHALQLLHLIVGTEASQLRPSCVCYQVSTLQLSLLEDASSLRNSKGRTGCRETPPSWLEGRLGESRLLSATPGCCRRLRSPGGRTVYVRSWGGGQQPPGPLGLLSLPGDLVQRGGRRWPQCWAPGRASSLWRKIHRQGTVRGRERSCPVAHPKPR